jgi:hypothetical protein
METGNITQLTGNGEQKLLGQILNEMHSEDEGSSPSSAVAESSVQGSLGDGFLLLNKMVRERGQALTISMTTNGRIGIFELADEDKEAECIGEGDTLAEAIRDVVPF